MKLGVPNFEPSDTGSRPLDEKFLIDSRLGSQQLLRHSDGVRHATRMLAELDDRRTFVDIVRILAFSEIQNGNKGRIRPIGWDDLSSLNTLSGELN